MSFHCNLHWAVQNDYTDFFLFILCKYEGRNYAREIPKEKKRLMTTKLWNLLSFTKKTKKKNKKNFIHIPSSNMCTCPLATKYLVVMCQTHQQPSRKRVWCMSTSKRQAAETSVLMANNTQKHARVLSPLSASSTSPHQHCWFVVVAAPSHVRLWLAM